MTSSPFWEPADSAAETVFLATIDVGIFIASCAIMHLTKTLFAGLTFVLVLGISIDAFADNLQCKEIRDGDTDACNAKVKRKCTQAKYWDRRRCEHEIVVKADACETPDYEKACKAATKIHAHVCRFGRFDFGKPKQLNDFTNLVISAEKQVSRYREFHNKWKQCYTSKDPACSRSNGDYRDCEEAPERLHKRFEKAIDEVVERSGRILVNDSKDSAERLLAVIKQLPSSHPLQARKNNLKKVIAQANATIVQEKAHERALVAKRRCPKGKKLKGKFMKLVMARTNKKAAKIVRQTGPKHRDRNGLINTESIPITICAKKIDKDGDKVCSKISMSVYREKPPGGSWTSWAAAVGGDTKINCKKLK